MARRGSQPSFRTVLLIGCEAGLILCAIAFAVWVRFGQDALDLLFQEHGLLKALLVTSACQFCLYYADLYDLRATADRRELFIRTLQALGAASLIVATLYFFFPALIFQRDDPLEGRGYSVIAAVLVIIITIGWRMAFVWATTLVGPRERVLIVGTNEAAVRLARELYDRRAELGVVIAGFVDPDPSKVGQTLMNHGVIGSVDDIPQLVRDLDVDRVVVSLADARGKLSMERLLEMRMAGVEFAQLPSVYEQYTGKIAIDNLRPSWLIFSDGFAKVSESGGFKRIIDVVGSALLLALAQPVMVLAGLAIKATSPGPVLYKQQRVGMNNRVFTIYKFRSMRADAEAATGAVWATPGRDPRVTTVGAFLRRSRIDELPQLWNVLRGDMSLVGPRPERPEFVSKLTEQIPFYGQRHAVRHGLTGWAQVRYAYGASVEDAMEKLQYDLYYIKNRSIALDAYIIFETLKTVVTRSGS
jgi:sugar transferase (PEP-CTERM system associated)